MQFPNSQFSGRDPVQMKRRLDEAQRVAAKAEPQVAKLYDALSPGEADREKLSAPGFNPRWRAGYDLAMGRALAAKARIEGYNAMLALLKQGRKFQQAGSAMWVLKPADTIEAGSALDKLAKRARDYLNRVVKEHPDTPWAHIAQLELDTKFGWEWTER
jgi:hypothetical protein